MYKSLGYDGHLWNPPMTSLIQPQCLS